MKTAMQEAIEHFKNINYDLVNVPIQNVPHILEQLLEKEKEQIVKAFNDGHHADVGHVDKAWEYYYQTYNTKQHIIDIMKADEEDGLYNQNK
ncbi:MAG: hypothetical protein RIR55_607 [Bacteroidota bacterium]|jgi:hypothetical protein